MVKKKRVTTSVLRIIGLLVLFAVVLFAAILWFGTRRGKSTVSTLSGVEVREYHGENLSSINDFIENSIKGPQYIDIKNYTLTIDGLVKNKKSLTYEQVLNHKKYSKIVKLNCVEGWSVDILWEGILLKDLLMEAEIEPGANTVIFYAYDGYSSSLPLDYILNNNIILADKMNDVIIPPERGYPFMVVAEDKWGYKWVKWVTRIEVSNDKNYKGYWEKSGYSQSGDLSAPMFDR